MSTAKFNSVDVPYVYSQVTNREFIGDRVRLAGGTMHQDTTGDTPYKRTWEIQTRMMTYSEADAILTHLYSNNGYVDFYLDDIDETVSSYVNINNEERVQFHRDGTFHDDGRRLTFEVIEE